jgi:hypothetical protein
VGDTAPLQRHPNLGMSFFIVDVFIPFKSSQTVNVSVLYRFRELRLYGSETDLISRLKEKYYTLFVYRHIQGVSKKFTNLKAYINVIRGHVQCFELS